MEHAGRILVRLNKGRIVPDRIWVEDDDVGEESLASARHDDRSSCFVLAVLPACEWLLRVRGLFRRGHISPRHVQSCRRLEDVRIAVQEYAFGSNRCCIRIKADPGQGDGFANNVFGL